MRHSEKQWVAHHAVPSALERLRGWVDRSGLTRQAIAKRAGIENSVFSRLLNGKVPASKLVARRIENLTEGEISSQELLYPDEAPSSSILRSSDVVRKRPTNVSLSGALLDEARALNINVSKAAEQGLALRVAEARAKVWRDENKKSIEAWNDYVDRHGLPLGRYRQF